MIVRAGTFRWRVRDDFDRTPLESILSDPEGFLREASLHFKNSKVVTVSRVPSLAPNIPRLVLRRLNYGKWRHRLRDFLRPSRVQRAFRNGVLLEQAGIATARPIAATDVRWWRWPVSAYLLTEEIVGAKTLAAFVAENPNMPFLVVRRLAGLMARLHENGFSHRDLKLTNVLIDEQLRPYLIDLDGLRVIRFCSTERAVKDLARLARDLVATPGLLRRTGPCFLKIYCRNRGGSMTPRELGEAISRELADL